MKAIGTICGVAVTLLPLAIAALMAFAVAALVVAITDGKGKRR